MPGLLCFGSGMELPKRKEGEEAGRQGNAS